MEKISRFDLKPHIEDYPDMSSCHNNASSFCNYSKMFTLRRALPPNTVSKYCLVRSTIDGLEVDFLILCKSATPICVGMTKPQTNN
jgi:hypothetical protein